MSITDEPKFGTRWCIRKSRMCEYANPCNGGCEKTYGYCHYDDQYVWSTSTTSPSEEVRKWGDKFADAVRYEYERRRRKIMKIPFEEFIKYEKEDDMPNEEGGLIGMSAEICIIDEPFWFYKSLHKVEKVIFNPPATIVIWKDGHKEVVKCADDETFEPEVGVAMCFMKRIFGSRNQFKKLVKSGNWPDIDESETRWHDVLKFIREEVDKINGE